MKIILIYIVTLYQQAISPYVGHRCRFYPSCSDYMKECLMTFGAVRGLGKGLRRLFRCHPLGGSGFDPIQHP